MDFRVGLRSQGCCWIALIGLLVAPTLASCQVIVGGTGTNCLEDPGCFNRLHPDVPMAARARPGQSIVFHVRDMFDIDAQNADSMTADRLLQEFGKVHALAGPVYIEGARAGDTLAVTLNQTRPAQVGWTLALTVGFAGDLVGGNGLVIWRLNDEFAVSDGIPGVRIPNASFPGIVTTLPGNAQLQTILEREKALLAAGGAGFSPNSDLAVPAKLCGADGAGRDTCLRTIPPREHGGNMDIRYFGPGVTIFLPCYIDGCGLAIGDLHFAQGDGEVSGTAIEMGGYVELTSQIIKDGPDLSHGPHYQGSAALLGGPTGEFYAVTGFPLKTSGDVPRDMEYLDSAKIAALTNLSNDIGLAARNALDAILDYIVVTYGYDRQQAYVIASVAVDLRIAQLVNAPNVGVTAILPLDIFEPRDSQQSPTQ